MRLPTADVAANDHAEAMADNPAGIGFGEGADFTYAVTSSQEDAADQGHGLFLALELIGAWHTGVGVQLLEQAGRQDTEPVKITWANALQLSEQLSVGLAWHTFVADEQPQLDDLDTYDFGLQYRPLRWIAAGLNVTDFTSPRVSSAAVGTGTPPVMTVPTFLPRGYEMGLAVRPGTERVTLSGHARIEEGRARDPAFGGRLRLALPGPFALVGRYDTAEIAGERTHAAMLGFTDQLADRLLAGVFGYAPDLAAENLDGGLAVIARTSSEREAEPPLLQPPLIVEVPVTGELAEYGSGGLFATRPHTPFMNLLLDLKALGESEEVAAVVLAFGDPDLGWARATELRQSIRALRAAGKRVYAYITVADTRVYSVAAAADKIYIAPSGGLLITGMRSEPLYLNELLTRVGIEPQFVAIGDYKSAPEMFTRRGPSEPARQQTLAIMDDLYARLLAHIAAGRGLTTEKVSALVDGAPYTAPQAKEQGLVDAVLPYDELERIARDDIGPRFRFVEVDAVLDRRNHRWGPATEIAVLYVAGTITDGDSLVNPFTGTVTVGGDSFVRAARRLREDPWVKAVVLRIDSPGGSVTASDAMWRELKLLADEKPLIVSMGDIAASGGYYVAAPGAEILASPETITGSIGIFTGKFDLTGLFWLLGVHREVFQRGARADLLSTASKWDDDDLKVVQAGMESLYRLFLERVAAGRQGLNIEQLDGLGRGRVYTGEQARACGLVDRPEGLIAALNLAASKAGLGEGDYVVTRWPHTSGLGALPRSPVHALEGVAERLAALLQRTAAPAGQAPIVPSAIGPLLDLPLLWFRSGQPLALLPFTLND